MPGETKCLVSTDGRCSADLPVSLRLAVYRLTPTEERPVPRRLPPAVCRLPPAACRLPPAARKNIGRHRNHFVAVPANGRALV